MFVGVSAIKGQVVNKIQGFYYVKLENGEVKECKLKGILKRNENRDNCVVGDNVEITDDTISHIFERKNLLRRPLVANIDYLAIQFSAKDPIIDYERLNLLLLSAFYYKITPIVIVNKIDLINSQEILEIKEKLSFLDKIGIKYFLVSEAKNIGLEILKEFLKGKITAFGGPSGVGKSSIINTLQNQKKLETGETSKRLKRGKHTTKDTNLLEMKEGGYIIDTPGFSSVELPNIDNENQLIELFPEFISDKNCKFSNCYHINEPNCTIKDGVETGKISSTRYEFYKKIYQKLKNERWKRYE